MMTGLKSYLGVALVIIGALLLMVGYIAGWTSSNLVLLTGLIIIVLGAVLHIKQQKKSEKFASAIGVALVIAGALLLIVSKIVGWTSSNLVLLTGLVLIILGIILHVKSIKSAEKY